MRQEEQIIGRARIVQKVVKRATLALAMAGISSAFAGCVSVHVHKEDDQPPPVIVVPNDHPNP